MFHALPSVARYYITYIMMLLLCAAQDVVMRSRPLDGAVMGVYICIALGACIGTTLLYTMFLLCALILWKKRHR